MTKLDQGNEKRKVFNKERGSCGPVINVKILFM